jgi:hypothetical protein
MQIIDEYADPVTSAGNIGKTSRQEFETILFYAGLRKAHRPRLLSETTTNQSFTDYGILQYALRTSRVFFVKDFP